VADSTPFFALSPNNTANSVALVARCAGSPNDYYEDESGMVPCDANGDVYFQCVATGAGTLDVVLQLWGYLW
jgi:hypothetical protein